jgi:TRAP-type C4-dicarboxylate transport system substrate-binding protein
MAREAQLEQRKLWDAAVADYTTKLKAEGVEFIEMDNKVWFDATAPVRAKYGAQYADLMGRISAVK